MFGTLPPFTRAQQRRSLGRRCVPGPSPAFCYRLEFMAPDIDRVRRISRQSSRVQILDVILGLLRSYQLRQSLHRLEHGWMQLRLIDRDRMG